MSTFVRGLRGQAVAVCALCVALSGTSYAAGMITGKSIKNHSITGADIKLHSLTATDLARGTLRRGATGARGPAGPQGPAGPTGPTGSPGPGGSTGATSSGESWHDVGAVGEPTFQSGWANSGNGSPASFYVDPVGRVHLKGVIAGTTASSLVFILPPGYRPQQLVAFAVAAGSPGPTLENVDVLSDGEVITNGLATTVALDGISFRVR